MFTRNIEFLCRERDKERLLETEHIRLVKIATNKDARFKGQRILLSMLAALIVAGAAVPALAQPPRDCSLFGLHNGLCNTRIIQKTSSVLHCAGRLLSR